MEVVAGVVREPVAPSYLVLIAYRCLIIIRSCSLAGASSVLAASRSIPMDTACTAAPDTTPKIIYAILAIPAAALA